MTSQNSIRFRIEPVVLHNVNEQHRRGVFGRFEDVIRVRLSELRQTKYPFDAEKVRFFEFLLSEVDVEAFGQVQDDFLNPDVLDVNSNMVKYIDPVVWFESKLAIAYLLNLHKRPPMKIIDLGTGPGHFPVVARFYGHDVIGTDLPHRWSDVAKNKQLYDALCEVYKVQRRPLTIQPRVDLPDLGGRFDLVTALMAAFNIENRAPWDINTWNFFLSNLRKNVLTEKGELFMGLALPNLTDEVWDYLSSRSSYSAISSRLLHITDFNPFLDDIGSGRQEILGKAGSYSSI